MRLALITAPNGFNLVREFPLDYHLVLAQKCLDDPEYLNFYKIRQEQGDFIILDNGAAELQHSIHFESILHVAEMLKPNEIVLPDELGNYEETRRLFLAYYNDVPKTQRFGVPQGENWDEWYECLQVMLTMGVHTIGIAKRYEAFPGGRASALNRINQTGEMVDVHLLGCYSSPMDEVRAAKKALMPVRGIDTAAPIAHAQLHLPIHAQQSLGHIPYEWGGLFHLAQARENIQEMIKLCTSS